MARHLGKKVYVASAKRRIMGCLDLAPEYASLLTTSHLETNLHAVPLGKVNMKGMEELLKHYKGRYTTAVGFQPTGWTQVRTLRVTDATLWTLMPRVLLKAVFPAANLVPQLSACSNLSPMESDRGILSTK